MIHRTAQGGHCPKLLLISLQYIRLWAIWELIATGSVLIKELIGHLKAVGWNMKYRL